MVMDFLSAEIIPGGHVSAKMSLGGGTAVAMATSNIIRVNDGQWHNVMIRVRSKVMSYGSHDTMYSTPPIGATSTSGLLYSG